MTDLAKRILITGPKDPVDGVYKPVIYDSAVTTDLQAQIEELKRALAAANEHNDYYLKRIAELEEIAYASPKPMFPWTRRKP